MYQKMTFGRTLKNRESFRKYFLVFYICENFSSFLFYFSAGSLIISLTSFKVRFFMISFLPPGPFILKLSIFMSFIVMIFVLTFLMFFSGIVFSPRSSPVGVLFAAGLCRYDVNIIFRK